LLAVVLVGLGATNLSMSPGALADVRATLSQVTLPEARALARRAMAATSAPEARSVVSKAAVL
jgi:phosphotransferase system enzyme I (PtsI)